jgi:hypothetical protein
VAIDIYWIGPTNFVRSPKRYPCEATMNGSSVNGKSNGISTGAWQIVSQLAENSPTQRYWQRREANFELESETLLVRNHDDGRSAR